METRSYTLLGVIGVGGYGTVYKARMEASEGFVREVAIKLMHPDLTERVDGSALKRLRDEARILGLMQDRAVVSVEPPIQLDGRWAVVMDYVEGQSCLELLRHHGAFPPPVAVEIVGEIARCLHKAYHLEGPRGPLRLLHRDIKPANIQITSAGEVRLLDFGVARAEFDAREAQSSVSLVNGTPGYIAPERMQGTEGPEGDVYSLGMVFWNMLTGKPARLRDTQKVGGWTPGMDDAMALAEAMLSLDPDARPTAGEVEQRIREMGRDATETDLRTWAQRVDPGELDQDDPLTGRMLTATLTTDAAGPRSRLGLYAGVVGGSVVVGSLLALLITLFIGGTLAAWVAWDSMPRDPPTLGKLQSEPQSDPSTASPDTPDPAPAAAPDTVPDAAPRDPVPALDTDALPEPTPEPEPEPEQVVDPSPEDTDEPVPDGPEILISLDPKLAHPGQNRRVGAVVKLEEHPDAAEALRYIMRNDAEENVRQEAFQVVLYQADRGIGDPDILALALGDVLLDRVRLSQRKAAIGYGKVGTDLAPLSRVLRRGAPTARNEAIRAAVEIGERTDRRAEARAMLVSASSRITGKTQQRTLEKALETLSDE